MGALWEWGGWMQPRPSRCLLLDITVLTGWRVGLGNPWGSSPQFSWKPRDPKKGEVWEGVFTTHHPARLRRGRGVEVLP